MPFEFLNHMADVYIRAYGRDLKEAFESAAVALFEIMLNVSKVDPVESVKLKVDGYDRYQLLYNWLESLLILFTVRSFALRKAAISELKLNGQCSLDATIYGETYVPEKHEARMEVKSPTYSLMEIREGSEGAEVRFVLDI